MHIIIWQGEDEAEGPLGDCQDVGGVSSAEQNEG